jgi:hypothetical protein
VLQLARVGTAPGLATQDCPDQGRLSWLIKDQLTVYAAAFSSVPDAEKALDTIEQLYKNGAVGTLDAAVIDKENGKPMW